MKKRSNYSNMSFLLKFIIFAIALLAMSYCQQYQQPDTSNVIYVLLSSSKFYFNYRHTGNMLSLYYYLKKAGVTDDRIILMLPENHACNARNPYPGSIYFDLETRENLYCSDIEIDYKSEDLTYESILNLFRGRYEQSFPQHKRLQSNPGMKVFIYMNGHGGENFFKIQDTEVVHSEDLAKVFYEMHLKRLYEEVLLIVDTCEALSLFDQVEAPNIVMVGTSVHGEHALSHQTDSSLNTYLNDKFTYFFYQYLTKEYGGQSSSTKSPKKGNKNPTGLKLSEFPKYFTFDKLQSKLQIKSTHKTKTLDQIYLQDYIPVLGTQKKGNSIGQKRRERFNYADFEENSILFT